MEHRISPCEMPETCFPPCAWVSLTALVQRGQKCTPWRWEVWKEEECQGKLAERARMGWTAEKAAGRAAHQSNTGTHRRIIPPDSCSPPPTTNTRHLGKNHLRLRKNGWAAGRAGLATWEEVRREVAELGGTAGDPPRGTRCAQVAHRRGKEPVRISTRTPAGVRGEGLRPRLPPLLPERCAELARGTRGQFPSEKDGRQQQPQRHLEEAGASAPHLARHVTRPEWRGLGQNKRQGAE